MAAPFRIRKFQKLPTLEALEAPGGGVREPTSTENFQLYMENLIKLIPAEVISLYLTGKGFFPPSQKGLWIWSLICLVLVIIVRIWGTREADKPVQWAAVVIPAISFVIWVYAVGGQFIKFDLPMPVIPLAVLVWTFVVPKFYKGD